MAEENQQQVQQEPQQVTTKEPQQVTTKNRKKVEAGKRLAAHNRRKREELKVKREEQAQKTTKQGFTSELNQYHGIGIVLAVGVIGGLGCHIYRTKKGGLEGPASGEVNNIPNRGPWPPALWNPPKHPSPKVNKFEMD